MKQTNKEKLTKIGLLALWFAVAVGIYLAFIKANSFVGMYLYLAAIVICAVAYAVIYVKTISLRAKANISPQEKFDYEMSDKLNDAEKQFLRKAQKGIKVIMFIAVPLLFIILGDYLITVFFAERSIF